MIKAVSLLIARETQAWLEALYENGAVTFGSDGTVSVDPDVRESITKMHDALAAGDSAKMQALEKAFDDALEATNEIGADLGAGVMSI